MDPLRFAIAAAPLGVYFLLIGIIHLRKLPFVTTGARDIAALGIGISGLMTIGPLELFFPEAASRSLGYWVWLLVLAFYGLCVALVVLLLRPRIVIYNARPERIRSVISEFAFRLDRNCRWVEDTLILPTLNVKFNIEGNRFGNITQLVAIGGRQSLEGWRTIEKELKQILASHEQKRSLIGWLFIGMATTLVLLAGVWMVWKSDQVAQSFTDLLRL
ncbi:MAG TPA: hypothetical protein PKD64_06640 [Pirellulaceae bacterium]|nr:hypothetical protein [Pirellulaceae bacterium]HMO91860.1 hypothetical protein [Pirellulaceae bacterium]HMP69730.1 hypothetical protein [Pirellulaceae bacterium]